MKRLVGLDIARGVAIVLMVVFHLFYDLEHFGFVHINITRNPFWLDFRTVIVSLFLFIVGVSLAIAHKESIKWQKVAKRTLYLAAAALAVTVGTLFVFPYAWVYFGVLHAILLFSFLALPFINRGFLALGVAFLILFAYNYAHVTMHPLFAALQKPLHLPLHTVDLVPLLPWFGVVLLGVATAAFGLHLKVFNTDFFNKKTFLHNQLSFLGEHALIIYLTHQAILFPLVWFLTLI